MNQETVLVGEELGEGKLLPGEGTIKVLHIWTNCSWQPFLPSKSSAEMCYTYFGMSPKRLRCLFLWSMAVPDSS